MKDRRGRDSHGDGPKRSLGHSLPVFTSAEKANLRQHLFREAALDDVDLGEADLRYARFEGCSLRRVSFEGANMIGAELLDCDLRGASFTRANLGRNRFHGSRLTGAFGLSRAAREEIRASGGLFLQLIKGGLKDRLLPEQIAGALRKGRRVADDLFDVYLPDHLSDVSSQFWTPLHVATRISEWLIEIGARTILDVGAGVGKFCVATALVTDCRLVGLEQRADLVEAASSLSKVFGVEERVSFVRGKLGEVTLDDFDAYYFFNPFGENLLEARARLDGSVELSKERWERDVTLAEQLLDLIPVGTHVITYNGFGGHISDCYSEVQVDRTMPSVLRLWRRVRAKGAGRYRVDAARD